MAHENQILTDAERLKHKIGYEKWRNSPKGIAYYEKLENLQKLKIEEYNKNPKLCEFCLKAIPFHNRKGKFCSQSCSATKRNTGRNVPETQKEKISIIMNQKASEKILTKECLYCKSLFQVNPCRSKKKYCSHLCASTDPNRKIWRGGGGYRKGSGIGKHGWYKTYWCDSSYELVFVIYNLEHNIPFSRNKQGFEYEWQGKTHLYYPDFMIYGEYVEIKGYWSKQHESKIKSFPHKLSILFKKDMQFMFDYVIQKYGKNFILLYE